MIMMCRLFAARARPEMSLDDEGREMRRRDAARAGQPVAVDDEDLVADRLQPVEPLEEVRVVEPADTGAIALHQPRPVQREGAGADPDQRNARRGRALEVMDGFGMEVLDLIDQPADDDEVIEAGRVPEPLLRLHDDARARRDRLHRRRQHPPGAEDRPRAVALVGGKTQHVHEVPERTEGEPPRQDETDVELGQSLTSVASLQRN